METEETTTDTTTAAPADGLRERVIEVIKTCYDPEIPVNIWELGLIYDVEVAEGGDVAIRMTLTSPACPVAGSLPPEVEEKVRSVEGVREAKVEVVWEPSWTPALMSEAAKLELNMM
jgi:FeS assembly SUF system protein